MGKRDRTILWFSLGAGVILLTLLCLGLWPFFGHAVRERLNRERFDPVAWQQKGNLTNAVRIRMVDDLVKRNPLKGMGRAEVLKLLGEPDKTVYFKEWDLVYWLGPERSFLPIDSEWLVIRLNKENLVKEYAVVTD